MSESQNLVGASCTSMPKHVAIVMDGNGRWAAKHGYPRVYGHIRGTRQVRKIVTEAVKLRIPALTLYAFSTENWSRPESEVTLLWRLLKKYLERNLSLLREENVCLKVIGELDRLEPDLRSAIESAVDVLSVNTGLCLTMALSYGGRREILAGVKSIAKACMQGDLSIDALCEEDISAYLWTKYLGKLADVDLFIRTSGEKRLSNFLLWQSAYAELVFLDCPWPEFHEEDFHGALRAFKERNRRFGTVSGQGYVTGLRQGDLAQMPRSDEKRETS